MNSPEDQPSFPPAEPEAPAEAPSESEATPAEAEAPPKEAPAPEAPAEEAEPPLVPTTFKERALGVVFLPEWAFQHHSGGWGWLKPWLFVALVGVFAGVVTLSSVDLTEVLKAQAEAGFDQLPASQREAMEKPEVREMIDKGLRMQAFGLKVWMIAGPFLGGLFAIVVFGGFYFVAARFLGGKDARVDLARSVSLAAWLSLVGVIQYAASALGVLSGNTTPFTSPQGLVSAAGSPVLHTVLSRLDPVTLLYYVLLSVGLTHSLRFERRRARLLALGLYAAFSFLLIAFVGGSAALRGASA